MLYSFMEKLGKVIGLSGISAKDLQEKIDEATKGGFKAASAADYKKQFSDSTKFEQASKEKQGFSQVVRD